MEYVKPIFSVQDFRALAKKEDASLLNKLVDMAGRRDLAGMRPFLEFLEIDGFNGNHALRGNQMTPPADKKRPVLPVIAPERKSIGHALLTTLTPVSALRSSVQAEMEVGDRHHAFLDRLLAIVNKQPDHNRQPWLNTLLRDACDAMANEAMVTKIIAAGAQPDAHMQTRHPQLVNQTVALANEALLRGNIPAATALAKNAPGSAVERIANAIVHGHETTGLNPEKIYPEAAAIAEGAAGRGRAPWALLEAIGERLGADAMVSVRLSVLTHHLRDGLLNQKDWSEEAVSRLVGERGGQPRAALAQAIAAEWRDEHEKKHEVAVFGQRPWRDLMKAALSSHCSQVLELFPDMLRHEASRKKSTSAMDLAPTRITMADAIVTSPLVQPASPFQAARFSRTLDVLMDHGFPLEKIDGQPVAVFLAAKNPSHVLGKLVVLLDKHIDINAEDAHARTAAMVVPLPMKARWDHVVNTHHARAKAHNILKDLETAGPAP